MFSPTGRFLTVELRRQASSKSSILWLDGFFGRYLYLESW